MNQVCIKSESRESQKYHEEHNLVDGGTQCGAGYSEKVREEEAFEKGYRVCKSCFPDKDSKSTEGDNSE